MKPYRTGYYCFMGEKVFVLRDYFDGLYFMWDGGKRLVETTNDMDWR